MQLPKRIQLKAFSFGCMLLLLLTLLQSHSKAEDEFWGFYGHRLINRMAVFTLPSPMVPLFKGNIEFITEHSIDPDKRRYAAPLEAVRHYIDLDRWGAYPFVEVPRDLSEAMIKYGSFHFIETSTGDTLYQWKEQKEWKAFISDRRERLLLHEVQFKLYSFLDEGYLKVPESWLPDSLNSTSGELVFTQYFTEFGMLPYHLSLYQGRLTKAFREQDLPLIIRLATEIGHYLSDAHVPLHTTMNYDGQLTGQDGLHAFWESRIPELFAGEEYDFFVGKAQYIEDTDDFFWEIILNSHTHVNDVVRIEKALRSKFEADQQYCFEERGGKTTRLECAEYARAYQEAMGGMVEEQMRRAIRAVGSSWYTAWVDAGEPTIANPSSTQIDTSVLMNADSMAAIQGVFNDQN